MHIFSHLSRLIFQSALNLSITLIRSIPSEQNFKEFSTTFNRNSAFSRVFKAPSKSRIKYYCLSKTSRSIKKSGNKETSKEGKDKNLVRKKK